MNKGKYVFSQVMEYFPRWVFDKAVKKYEGDLFGQIAGCKSLKDISLVLKSLKKTVYLLGIPTAVDPSSLSKANEARDYRIFEELGMWLIGKVRPIYTMDKEAYVDFEALYRMDQNVNELLLNF